MRGNVVYDCAEEKAYDCIGDSNEQYGNFEFNIYYYDDPGFVDCEGGNYSLRDDSRVYRDIPGFARIDYESIGRIESMPLRSSSL